MGNLNLYVAGQFETYYWALNSLAALVASSSFSYTVATMAFLGGLVTVGRVVHFMTVGQMQKAIGFALCSVFFIAMMFHCLTGGFNARVTLEDSVSGNTTVVANVPVIAIFPQWLISNIFTQNLAPQLEAVSQSTSATNGDLSVGGSGFLTPGSVLLKAREALFKSGDPLNTIVNTAFAQCIPSDLAGTVQKDISNPFTGHFISINGEAYATALGVVAYYASLSSNTYTGIGASPSTISPCSQMPTDLQTAYSNYISGNNFYRQFASDSFNEDRPMNAQYDYSSLQNVASGLLGIAKNGTADGTATTMNMLTYSVIEQNANCLNTSGASKVACIEAIQQKTSREQSSLDAMARASGSFTYASTFASLVAAFSIVISVVALLIMLALGYESFMPGMKAVAHAILAPTLVAAIANPVINGMMTYMLSVKFAGLANPNFVIDHAQIAGLYTSLSNYLGTASTLAAGAGSLMALFFGFGLSAGATSLLSSISGSDNYDQKLSTSSLENSNNLVNNTTPGAGEIALKGASATPGQNTIASSYLANGQIQPNVSQASGKQSLTESETLALSQTIATDHAIANEFVERISNSNSRDSAKSTGTNTSAGSGSSTSASANTTAGTDNTNSTVATNTNSINNQSGITGTISASGGLSSPGGGGGGPGASGSIGLQGSRGSTVSENASLTQTGSRSTFSKDSKSLTRAIDTFEKSDAYKNQSASEREAYNREKANAKSAVDRIGRNEAILNNYSASRSTGNDLTGAQSSFGVADFAGAATNNPRVQTYLAQNSGFAKSVESLAKEQPNSIYSQAIQNAQHVAKQNSYNGAAGNSDYDAAYQLSLAQSLSGVGGAVGAQAKTFLSGASQAISGVYAPTNSDETTKAGETARGVSTSVQEKSNALDPETKKVGTPKATNSAKNTKSQDPASANLSDGTPTPRSNQTDLANFAQDLASEKNKTEGTTNARIEQYKAEGVDDPTKSATLEAAKNLDPNYSHKFKDGK